MKQTRSLSEFTWCLKLHDFILELMIISRQHVVSGRFISPPAEKLHLSGVSLADRKWLTLACLLEFCKIEGFSIHCPYSLQGNLTSRSPIPVRMGQERVRLTSKLIQLTKSPLVSTTTESYFNPTQNLFGVVFVIVKLIRLLIISQLLDIVIFSQ